MKALKTFCDIITREYCYRLASFTNTVKPLNSGQKLSVTKRCPLLWGSLTKIATFGTEHFVCYSRHVHYLRCPLLGGFTVADFLCKNKAGGSCKSSEILPKVSKKKIDALATLEFKFKK